MTTETNPASADNGEFGRRLREARRRAGLTQSQLAKDLTTAGYVSLLESGQRRPSREMLDQLCRRLGVTPSDLGEAIDEEQAEFHLSAAFVALSSGDHARAVAEANDAISTSPPTADSSFRAEAIICEAALRADASAANVEAALRLIDRVPAGPVLARARLSTVAMRTMRALGDLALGVDCGTRWIREAEATDWPTDALVELILNTASCHLERGDGASAVALTERAIAMAHTLGSTRARMQTHWQYAFLMHDRGRHDEAVESIHAARRLCELAEMTETLARIESATATMLLDLPQPDVDLASDFADGSWNRAVAAQDHIGIAYGLMLRAKIALLREDAATAQRLIDDVRAVPNVPIDVALYMRYLQLRCQLLRGEELSWPDAETVDAVGAVEAAGMDRTAAQFWADLAGLFEQADMTSAAMDAYRRSLRRAHILNSPDPDLSSALPHNDRHAH